MLPSEVFSVRVTEFPEGSHDEEGVPNPDWSPEGWDAERASLIKAGILRLGEGFFWPKSQGLIYKSRSTARKRAILLRKYGASADVVKAHVEWRVS